MNKISAKASQYKLSGISIESDNSYYLQVLSPISVNSPDNQNQKIKNVQAWEFLLFFYLIFSWIARKNPEMKLRILTF